MPVIQSREKQVRKSHAQRSRNGVVRKQTKTVIKQFHTAVNAGDKDTALDLLNQSTRLLDRSFRKKAHNKNFVNRHKSRLHKAYNAL